MEDFSKLCASHVPPDLSCSAMPDPFLIQDPLPDLFYEATYYLCDSKTHLVGSIIKHNKVYVTF